MAKSKTETIKDFLESMKSHTPHIGLAEILSKYYIRQTCPICKIQVNPDHFEMMNDDMHKVFEIMEK